jgi:tetratricopeptide (TPR) repeat protein
MLRVLSSFTVVLALCASSSLARADEPADDGAPPPQPQGTFGKAMTDMEAGQFEVACPAFKRAYQEDPRAATIFYLAQCYEKWGRIATAVAHYDDYLAKFDQISPSEQAQEREREELASGRQQALLKKVPTIILRIPFDAPATTKVLRKSNDGGPSIKVDIGVALPIDPGEHVLTTEIPGRPPALTKFQIQVGEKKEVTVAIPKAEGTGFVKSDPVFSKAVKTVDLKPKTSKRRITAYSLVGVGAAGIIAGTVTGAVTWGQKDSIAKGCLPAEPKICNQSAVAAKETAKLSGLLSTIFFPVGAVALTTGVILYVTEPPASAFDSASAPGLRLNVQAGFGTTGVELNYSW